MRLPRDNQVALRRQATAKRVAQLNSIQHGAHLAGKGVNTKNTVERSRVSCKEVKIIHVVAAAGDRVQRIQVVFGVVIQSRRKVL